CGVDGRVGQRTAADRSAANPNSDRSDLQRDPSRRSDEGLRPVGRLAKWHAGKKAIIPLDAGTSASSRRNMQQQAQAVCSGFFAILQDYWLGGVAGLGVGAVFGFAPA